MTLTNEKLNQRFSNPFQLVTYAIGLAKERVSRGDGMRSHLATDVLRTIAKHEDRVEEESEEQK